MRRTWTVVVVAGARYNLLLVKDTSVLLGLLRGCVNEMKWSAKRRNINAAATCQAGGFGKLRWLSVARRSLE